METFANAGKGVQTFASACKGLQKLAEAYRRVQRSSAGRGGENAPALRPHLRRRPVHQLTALGIALHERKYVPTDENTADLFTKVLQRQPFEKHRKIVLNLPGNPH